MPSTSSSNHKKLLKKIYRLGWGKIWPQKTFTIKRREILPILNNNEIPVCNHQNAEGEEESIPEETNITYQYQIDLLQDAFGIGENIPFIVLREEYTFLRRVLEHSDRPFIVTGQSGTGKTAFLLYLLIHRMGRKLPTAVQFSDDEYISFNSTGAYACSTRVGDSIDRKFLPDGCWCLSDGNAHVRCPCYAFGRKGLRPFVITPSPPNNLWRAIFGADTVITDLPRTVEVAAIAHLLGHDPRQAVTLMMKWGPSVRSILNILKYENEENNLLRYAIESAIEIHSQPPRSVRRITSLALALAFSIMERALQVVGNLRSEKRKSLCFRPIDVIRCT